MLAISHEKGSDCCSLADSTDCTNIQGGHHGQEQGQPHDGDRQHEAACQDGEVANVQVY